MRIRMNMNEQISRIRYFVLLRTLLLMDLYIQYRMFSRQLSRLRVQHLTQYNLLEHKKMHDMQESLYAGRTVTWRLKLKFLRKETVYTLVQGSKDLWKDTKWFVNLKKSKAKEDYTGYQIGENERIKTDLLKFIPYSVILVVPFAELCLPFLLWLFPNMVPSFYIFDASWDKRQKTLQNIQQEAHKQLIDKIMDVMIKVYHRQPLELTRYQSINQCYFEIVEDLHRHLNYQNLTSDELIFILQFLGSQFVTGVGIINKIVNLFTLNIPRGIIKTCRFFYSLITKKTLSPYKDPFFVKGDFDIFKLNFYPFENIKRKILLRQIQNNFAIMRAQDIAFDKYGMDDIKGKEIKDYARERGLATISCYVTLKNFIKNDWVRFATNEKFKDNNNAKLWYSVLMYNFLKKTSRDLN